jgi:NAD(P)-dependent dehydrogenase (short-subunit alcohol dehydrogenase family)
MVGQLDNKIARVTGSGQGLGSACAPIFAREGAKVVVVDFNQESRQETVALVRQAGGEAASVTANVARSADVQAAAINNAVCNISRYPLADITDEDWDRALAVNFTGVFLCMRYEIKAMLQRGGGPSSMSARAMSTAPCLA